MEDINKLFNDNINLVYHVSKKFYNTSNMGSFDIDDIHQLGSIGLFKACKLYDKSKNIKFSTYAYKAIYNEIVCEITRNNGVLKIPRDKYINKERLEILSLDYKIADSDGHTSEVHELIEDPYNRFEEIEFNIIFNKILKKSDSKTKFIVQAIIKGYTQQEIATMMGYEQSTISKYFVSFKKKLKNELRRNNYEI